MIDFLLLWVAMLLLRASPTSKASWWMPPQIMGPILYLPQIKNWPRVKAGMDNMILNRRMLLIWMILFVFVFIRLWKKCTVFSLKIFIDHYFFKTKKRCAITRTIVLGGNGKRTTQRSICVLDICVHLWLCRDTRRCKVHCDTHRNETREEKKAGADSETGRTLFSSPRSSPICALFDNLGLV